MPWDGFSSQDGPNAFSSMLTRQGATPTNNPRAAQPRPQNPNPAPQRTPGMTPWGQPAQPHSGPRGGFGAPNPGAMAGRQFGGSPWSFAAQNPKGVDQFGNIRFPDPGPVMSAPDPRFPKGGEIIPPGPPGGSYGPGEPPPWKRGGDYIPPGPAGQSYGPMEGGGYIPPGPPQGYGPFDERLQATIGIPFGGGGPYNPNAKPGQITGAIPMPADFGIPGMPNISQRLWAQIQAQQSQPKAEAIPPGPAGQSYGPSEEFLGRPDAPGGWEWGVRNNRDRWNR